MALYMNGDNVTYCDRFWVENIPKKIKKFIGNKNITTNTYKEQGNDSVMQGYYQFYWFYGKRWKFIRLHQFVFS